jgi:hypothetical protein
MPIPEANVLLSVKAGTTEMFVDDRSLRLGRLARGPMRRLHFIPQSNIVAVPHCKRTYKFVASKWTRHSHPKRSAKVEVTITVKQRGQLLTVRATMTNLGNHQNCIDEGAHKNEAEGRHAKAGSSHEEVAPDSARRNRIPHEAP